MNEIKGSVQHSLEVTKCDRYFRKALEYSIQNVKMKMHVERSHEESDLLIYLVYGMLCHILNLHCTSKGKWTYLVMAR